MSARTIEQKMSSGSPWDGAAPAGDAVFANDMESFSEGAAGGLFDFKNKNPIEVIQVMIGFAAGTTLWNLIVVDIDDVEINVELGGNALPFFATIGNGGVAGLILLQGQKLKLTSLGGTTVPSRARISVIRHRS